MGGAQPEQPAPSRRGDRRIVGPFSLRHMVVIVAVALAVGLGLVALNTPLTGAPSPTAPRPGSSFFPVGDPVVGLRQGDVAPELEGTHGGQTVGLTDLDGRPIRLADLRGRVVWLNFWATWCPPCQEETPVLRDVHERYRDEGLELVAVSVQETTADDVRRYVETYGLEYTVGFDATSAIFRTYRAFGLPTQFFIGRDGIVEHVVLGPVTRDQAANLLEPMLGE